MYKSNEDVLLLEGEYECLKTLSENREWRSRCDIGWKVVSCVGAGNC